MCSCDLSLSKIEKPLVRSSTHSYVGMLSFSSGGRVTREITYHANKEDGRVVIRISLHSGG